jgi:hypothetical protein
MSQIANAQPQGGLILGAAPSVPGGAAELRQATGPRTAHRECGPKPVGQLLTACGPEIFFAGPPRACVKGHPNVPSCGHRKVPTQG